MEDVVSDLLPGAAEVAFVDLPATVEAAIASVVIVAPRERMREAAEALKASTEAGGIRPILIVSDAESTPAVRSSPDGVVLEGLKPEHLDNAVAALRLSSLPTLVWWRGGSPAVLPRLAALADRLVLDAVDPLEVWPLVGQLAERTAVTDIRWARLTRWRTLLAHFFDIPDVRDDAGAFHSLEVRGGDVHAARLFAGWLISSLAVPRSFVVDVQHVAGAPAILHVRLSNRERRLVLRLAESRTCVVTAVEGTRGQSSRIVSLGDQGLAALIAEELRVRSHDVAFERAVRAMEEQR
jgi:glucose-6-phosphate dehydrogenase assembly protein OpcA